MTLSAAKICLDMSVKNKKILILCITIPYGIPVLGAIILNIFGPIDVGIILENNAHLSYQPPRWHFMNMSANGFGFDAAITSCSLFIFFRQTKTLHFKILLFVILLLSIYALLWSGTRAAMLFFLSAVSVYEIVIGKSMIINKILLILGGFWLWL